MEEQEYEFDPEWKPEERPVWFKVVSWILIISLVLMSMGIS